MLRARPREPRPACAGCRDEWAWASEAEGASGFALIAGTYAASSATVMTVGRTAATEHATVR